MSIVTLVTAERDRYVAFFEKAAGKALADNPQSVRELLISLDDETIPAPYCYLRIDLLGKGLDGSDHGYELWLDPAPESEGRGFSFGSATVEIYPFTWCSATIAFNRPVRDVAALDQRLTHLLDVGDERREQGSQASGAIHSATKIETNDQLWYFTVDFGTSPADALLDLIDFLLDQGITRVLVRSEVR